jgi:hypothetical protein
MIPIGATAVARPVLGSQPVYTLLYMSGSIACACRHIPMKEVKAILIPAVNENENVIRCPFAGVSGLKYVAPIRAVP